MSSVLRSGLVDLHGSPVSVARGFLTSDNKLFTGVKMRTFFIATSQGIRPLNSSKLFRKWMESRYGRSVLEVSPTFSADSAFIGVTF